MENCFKLDGKNQILKLNFYEANKNFTHGHWPINLSLNRTEATYK